jgi:hypothetical protein
MYDKINLLRSQYVKVCESYKKLMEGRKKRVGRMSQKRLVKLFRA